MRLPVLGYCHPSIYTSQDLLVLGQLVTGISEEVRSLLLIPVLPQHFSCFVHTRCVFMVAIYRFKPLFGCSLP